MPELTDEEIDELQELVRQKILGFAENLTWSQLDEIFPKIRFFRELSDKLHSMRKPKALVETFDDDIPF